MPPFVPYTGRDTPPAWEAKLRLQDKEEREKRKALEDPLKNKEYSGIPYTGRDAPWDNKEQAGGKSAASKKKAAPKKKSTPKKSTKSTKSTK